MKSRLLQRAQVPRVNQGQIVHFLVRKTVLQGPAA